MKFDNLVKLCHRMWLASRANKTPLQTVCLLGPPGIGKTTIGRVLAALMTESMRASNPKADAASCRELDLSSMLPEDLNGLPFRDGESTKFCAHAWLHDLCKPDAYGVLVLDDLPASSPMMQVAARQLSLERRVHEHKLSDNIFIIVTGNRREDKSSATTLPSHFRNSVVMLEVEVDVEDWCNWYAKQDALAAASVIPAFLYWKRDRLSMLPKDAGPKNGAFATPRSWAKLGLLYYTAEQAGALLDVATGLVGEGVATEFAAFCRTRAQMVPPDQVLADPERAIPKPQETLATPDKIVAMVTGIAEVVSTRSRDLASENKRVDLALQFLRAVSWVTIGNHEYTGAALNTFTANGGRMEDVLLAAKNNKSDPVVKNMIGFLKKSLNT